MAVANTPLLANPEFNGRDGWLFGANQFQPATTWIGFAEDPETFSVTPTGNGAVFNSWDDLTSDKIESFVYQQFNAGPPGSATENTIFQTGDKIVFKGAASATRSGTDPSDMIVRAFIKTLGYNELGWEFQIKPEYTQFHDIGPDVENFDLSINFPDLAADDSFQVVQLGFEITTEYDGAAMDSGSITFGNLEGYIEGEEIPMWAGYEIDENGDVDTGSWMGKLYVEHSPWVWSYDLGAYVFIDPANVGPGGSWIYVLQ